MAMLLQRICWNEHLWARPSGPPKDEGPKEYGFGFDEWNFNLEDAYKGYVYAHTPYSPSDSARDGLPTPFCVAFWTKNPKTRQAFLVGFYENAEWTTDGQSKEFDRWLRKGGRTSRWARRKGELLSAAVPKGKIDAEFQPGGHVWKLRCPKGKVWWAEGWMSVPKALVAKHQRFSTPRLWRDGSAPPDLLRRCSAPTEAARQLGYERVTPKRVAIIDQNEERLQIGRASCRERV